MKRIIFIVLSAVVLSLLPATYASAQWKYKGDYHEGLAKVQDANGKYGYINEAGKLVIPCKWKSAESFSEGLARVEDANGKYGFINKKGKLVIPCKWKGAGSFWEGLAEVKDANDKYGFINKTGKLVIPCQWQTTWGFHEGLAKVRDANDKCGFIDKTGKLVSPCQWRWACNFYEGLAYVEDANEKVGFIDKTGKVVIPLQFGGVENFHEGLAKVADNGKWFQIDKSGTPYNPSVDPNSMSWPSPSYDSGWELKNERLFSNKKCWNRGLKWNGGKVVQIIKEIDEHSGRVKHYWVVESGKVYKNENDAEGAAYFYSVYDLKRTRGEGSNFIKNTAEPFCARTADHLICGK